MTSNSHDCAWCHHPIAHRLNGWQIRYCSSQCRYAANRAKQAARLIEAKFQAAMAVIQQRRRAA